MSAPTRSGYCTGCHRDGLQVAPSDAHFQRVLCERCTAKPAPASTAPPGHHWEAGEDGPVLLPDDLEAAPPANGVSGGDAPSAAAPLAQRLAGARVDLLAYIENGVPARDWLPGSEAMLARSKRHHVSAPLKSGKSLGFLTHAVNMVIAGARVVILDRENGADEYARRLRDILGDRPADARDAIRDRLAYYAWPAIRLTDGQGLAAAISKPDLVILDSTRTFLSGFQLDEDSSDDFAKFAAAIVEPLFRAGIATVQLDNTGHGDKGRARGTSSKGDLADVNFNLKTTTAFDAQSRGKLQLKRADSRLGDVAPAFTMELGAGHFGAFTADSPGGDAPPPDTFRPTVLMERVSRALEDHPGLSKRAIRDAIRGRNDAIELALELLIADGHVRARPDGQAIRHYVERPYQDDEEANRAPVPQPCPDRAPGTVEGDRAPVPPPYRGTGHGAHPATDTDPATVPLATEAQEREFERLAAEFPDLANPATEEE